MSVHHQAKSALTNKKWRKLNSCTKLCDFHEWGVSCQFRRVNRVICLGEVFPGSQQIRDYFFSTACNFLWQLCYERNMCNWHLKSADCTSAQRRCSPLLQPILCCDWLSWDASWDIWPFLSSGEGCGVSEPLAPVSARRSLQQGPVQLQISLRDHLLVPGGHPGVWCHCHVSGMLAGLSEGKQLLLQENLPLWGVVHHQECAKTKTK